MTEAAAPDDRITPTYAERPGPGLRRFIDPGAIFAGWVGLGMGLVIAIAFELIIAVQSIVFLVAPVAGLIIGAYANVRSARWRPRGRALANAAYAGIVTGVGLALLYVVVRLVFIYADNGFPQFNRVDANGQPVGEQCVPGPACTYARYLEAGQGETLAANGITDATSFEAFIVRDHVNGGLLLVGLTVGGALAAGARRAARTPRGEGSGAG